MCVCLCETSILLGNLITCITSVSCKGGITFVYGLICVHTNAGLDVEKDHILEMSCIITDQNLNKIAEVMKHTI